MDRVAQFRVAAAQTSPTRQRRQQREDQSLKIVEDIERDWARLIGTQKIRTLRELLLDLNAALWPG